MSPLTENKNKNKTAEDKMGDFNDLIRLKGTYFLASITVTTEEEAIMITA